MELDIAVAFLFEKPIVMSYIQIIQCPQFLKRLTQ